MLSFNTHVFTDLAGLHSTSVNPSRFIAPATGRYRLTAQIRSDSGITSADDFIIGINKNAAGVYPYQTWAAGTTGGTITVQATSSWIQLSSGDYLEVGFATGATLNIDASGTWAVFEQLT
jgi:hypothetical protein